MEFEKPAVFVRWPMRMEVLAKVVHQTHADLTRTGMERTQIIEKIRNQKAQVRDEFLRDSILTKLTAEGKVKINRDAIKRFVASYRTSK